MSVGNTMTSIPGLDQSGKINGIWTTGGAGTNNTNMPISVGRASSFFSSPWPTHGAEQIELLITNIAPGGAPVAVILNVLWARIFESLAAGAAVPLGTLPFPAAFNSPVSGNGGAFQESILVAGALAASVQRMNVDYQDFVIPGMGAANSQAGIKLTIPTSMPSVALGIFADGAAAAGQTVSIVVVSRSTVALQPASA